MMHTSFISKSYMYIHKYDHMVAQLTQYNIHSASMDAVGLPSGND